MYLAFGASPTLAKSVSGADGMLLSCRLSRRRACVCAVITTLFLLAGPALAQSVPMPMPMPMPMPVAPAQAPPDTRARATASASDMPGMSGMPMGDSHMMGGMLGAYTMLQDASGTSWQPASTPMQGLMWSSGGWTGMIHGYADIVYDHQNGPRGDTEAFSESMLMAAVQHPEGAGTLTFRTMLSLDPAMGPNGYPLLLQTGETGNGVTPLIDRQHPHNVFMELAGAYSLPIANGTSAFLYLGYPGEPALGPVTFMHRFSGEDDPAAPITHHWLDSTHITFGVVTAGLVHGPWKVEASVFNGREPDQNRWDFQPLRLDSASARVTFNPTPNWSFQTSYGYLHSPEQLTPNMDQHRLTASTTYNQPLKFGNWQTTLAWGRNDEGAGHALDGFLMESALGFGASTIFARAEQVQKDDLIEGSGPLADQTFRVAETTLGYVYDIAVAQHVALGLGFEGTVNFVPSRLSALYGSSAPLGYMPFLRLKLR